MVDVNRPQSWLQRDVGRATYHTLLTSRSTRTLVLTSRQFIQAGNVLTLVRTMSVGGRCLNFTSVDCPRSRAASR